MPKQGVSLFNHLLTDDSEEFRELGVKPPLKEIWFQAEKLWKAGILFGPLMGITQGLGFCF